MSSTTSRIIARSMLILLAMLITVILIASAREKMNGPKAQAAIAGPQRLSPPRTIPGPVQVVRFTVYDVGIYPREARVEPGLVAISIEDQAGGRSGLIVERVEGEVHIAQGRIDRLSSRFRTRGELLLTPGHYEIKDSERPSNKALLIVEP